MMDVQISEFHLLTGLLTHKMEKTINKLHFTMFNFRISTHTMS